MTDVPPTLYCANHPQTPTTLRCNRCEKPICSKCAVLTPTGYRCKECVRSQQKTFDTTQWYDYLTSFAVALILSYIGSYIVRIIPFLGFFVIFVGPIIGVIIAEAVRLVVRRRRSKLLFQLATVAAILGSLPSLFLVLLPLFFHAGIYSLLGILWQGVYTFLVTSTVYYRLAGVRFRT
jgi:B-box zinc finger